MEASVNTLAAARPALKAQPLAIPWFLYAALMGSTSIVIGGIWDISWHRSIGRDTFWSPPHMAIYLGGIVAGLSAAWVIFKTTFAGSAEERAAGVKVWGFRGPLGAFFCSWGGVAMLTSAPFDDWWHNAYGLDTKILSPPHVVLALGVIAIQVGAMLAALAHQNLSEQRAEVVGSVEAKRRARLRAMYAYTAGILLTAVYLAILEFQGRAFMHSSIFYQVACGVYPLFIVAAARASGLRWPAVATAGVYMALMMVMLWVLPLFPAEPKLGPVRHHLTHMAPLSFPLLLVVPAFAVDLVMRRLGRSRDWLLALWLGVAFFTVLLATQWLFGEFLISPGARNRFFGGHYLAYFQAEDWPYRYHFYSWDASTGALVRGLIVALVLAVGSARLGLGWGNWMRRVQR